MLLSIFKIENVPIDSNCYVLYDKRDIDKCIVVDPGSENCRELELYLNKLSLTPEYIILTHEHFDHIWGCNYLINKYKSKIITSQKCSLAIHDAKRNLSLFYDQKGFEVSLADIVLEGIEYNFIWRGYKLQFFPAQGHTAAGICFSVGKYLFTGDSLIKDTRTVTKLYSGSKQELINTINRIKMMKGEGIVICPGHGDMFDLDTYNLEKAL